MQCAEHVAGCHGQPKLCLHASVTGRDRASAAEQVAGPCRQATADDCQEGRLWHQRAAGACLSLSAAPLRAVITVQIVVVIAAWTV
eukprot:1159597-Pelagomonas_calceolata.AAC.16